MVDCQGQFVYNPNSFTEEEQSWIKNSSDRWNNWVGYKLTSVRPGNDDICEISPGSTNNEIAIGEANSHTQNITIDITDLKTRKIYNSSAFEGVVMHEIGHTLWFKHAPDKSNALMAPAGKPDFTEIDRIQCIKLGYCTTLNPPEFN